MTNNWIADYLERQRQVLENIPADTVGQMIQTLKTALQEDRQIFVIGNGGSAANASHFVTDLGKGASDKIDKRFRVMSLNDNVSWLTALGNDYAYEEVFVRQLENFARPQDVLLALSVSGNSPNLVKAFEWAARKGLHTLALVGGKRGRLADLAEQCLVVDDTHYGRAEDTQMVICHLLCYAFMELPALTAEVGK